METYFYIIQPLRPTSGLPCGLKSFQSHLANPKASARWGPRGDRPWPAWLRLRLAKVANFTCCVRREAGVMMPWHLLHHSSSLPPLTVKFIRPGDHAGELTTLLSKPLRLACVRVGNSRAPLYPHAACHWAWTKIVAGIACSLRSAKLLFSAGNTSCRSVTAANPHTISRTTDTMAMQKSGHPT